jgi:hypothetical protein
MNNQLRRQPILWFRKKFNVSFGDYRLRYPGVSQLEALYLREGASHSRTQEPVKGTPVLNNESAFFKKPFRTVFFIQKRVFSG